MESAKQKTWLALRAQAGDREAFDRLFRLLQGPLYRYIFSLVGARALAEDILQEVFIANKLSAPAPPSRRLFFSYSANLY